MAVTMDLSSSFCHGSFHPQQGEETSSHSGSSTGTRVDLSSASNRMAIHEPTTNDILCGKDKSYDRAIGNQLFRDIIFSFTDIYDEAPSKSRRMQITKDILNILKMNHNCRFIRARKHPDGSQWEEINDQKARDKISHALRYAKNGQNNAEDNSCDGTSSSTTAGSKKSKSRASIVRKLNHRKSHSDSRIKYSLYTSPQTVTASEASGEVNNWTNQSDLITAKTGLSEGDKQGARSDEEIRVPEDCDEAGISEEDWMFFTNLMLNDDDSTTRDNQEIQFVGSGFIDLNCEEIDKQTSHMPDEISFENTYCSVDDSLMIKEDHETSDDIFDYKDWDDNSSIASCLSSRSKN